MKQDTSSPGLLPPDALTIGLDLSDRAVQICTLDASGKVLEESKSSLTELALQRRFGTLPPALVALEVGTHSPWVSRLLESFGHRVLVANARQLRLITQSDSKTDRADAEILARVARMDPVLLAPIRHRSLSAQVDRSMLSTRASLVRARTALVNHARGIVKSVGGRLPTRSAESLHRLDPEVLPEPLRPLLLTLFASLAHLTSQIRALDREVERLARERYPESARLMQVPGVGALTALCFMLTLEDPHRFRSSREVGSYLGLRPRQRASGRSDPQLRITKAGDRYLRVLLVGAAQYVLGPFGPDTDLRRWGLKLAQRGGKRAKKQAVVAVARKLAVLLHRLWVSGATYEPLRLGDRGQEVAA